MTGGAGGPAGGPGATSEQVRREGGQEGRNMEELLARVRYLEERERVRMEEERQEEPESEGEKEKKTRNVDWE